MTAWPGTRSGTTAPGTPRALNTVQGSSEGDSINNEGLIQTALGTEGGTTTTFTTDDFYNDQNENVSRVPQLRSTATRPTRRSSMPTSMAVRTKAKGPYSYVALDAFLASSESGDAKADLLEINGDVSGTTGLIVNNINSDNEGHRSEQHPRHSGRPGQRKRTTAVAIWPVRMETRSTSQASRPITSTSTATAPSSRACMPGTSITRRTRVAATGSATTTWSPRPCRPQLRPPRC